MRGTRTKKVTIIIIIIIITCKSTVFVCVQKWLADWLIENNPNKAKLHDYLGCTIIPPS